MSNAAVALAGDKKLHSRPGINPDPYFRDDTAGVGTPAYCACSGMKYKQNNVLGMSMSMPEMMHKSWQSCHARMQLSGIHLGVQAWIPARIDTVRECYDNLLCHFERSEKSSVWQA